MTPADKLAAVVAAGDKMACVLQTISDDYGLNLSTPQGWFEAKVNLVELQQAQERLTEEQVKQVLDSKEVRNVIAASDHIYFGLIVARLNALLSAPTPAEPWICPNGDHACNLRGYCMNKSCERFEPTAAEQDNYNWFVKCPKCGFGARLDEYDYSEHPPHIQLNQKGEAGKTSSVTK